MSILEVVLLCIVIAGSLYALGKWLFRKDTEIEDRRRAAAKLAGILSKFGLVRIPAFLIDYSVGDYSGLAQRLKNLVELFVEGEEAVVKEFNEVFERCLTVKLGTEEGRAYIRAKLAEQDKAA